MLIAIVDDIAEERILLRTRLENILNQKNVEFNFLFIIFCIAIFILIDHKPVCLHFFRYGF